MQQRTTLARGLLVATCLFFCLLGTTAAKVPKKHKIKVDHLALAAVLLRDGHTKRAWGALAQVKLTAKTKPPRKARFFMLRGVLQLKRGDAGGALRSLTVSLRHGLQEPLLHVLMAQAHFRLAQYTKALQALSKAPPKARSSVGAYLLRSQSLWRLGRRHEAYRVLVQGYRKHPSEVTMVRLQALLLIELKLARAGYAHAQVYLGLQRRAQQAAKGASLSKRKELVEICLMFAGAFRKQKLLREAALFLEEAHLLLPGHVPTMLQLARVYLERQQVVVAADLLARAAWRKPSLMVEAAELYRRAGMRWRALYLNAQVTAQKPKVRQRLGLLIEQRQFEQAVALAPRLSRLGLLGEEPIVYALAYASYKTGRYKLAEKWLLRISEPGLFRKAIQLRKAMQACAKREWWCP